MNKTIAKGLVAGGVALSLCGPVLAATTVFQGESVTVKADQVAPTDTTIEIHKTMYDKKDAAFFESEQNRIKNDGTQKEDSFSDKLLHYNPKTMGKVEFTLYDITDQINKNYKDGKGLTGFTSGQSKEAQGRVAEIENDIEKNGEDSKFLSGAQVVGTKAIDEKGNVRFEGVRAYDASKPQRYHYYAAVETKTPKGFVVAKAKPIVFVNPYTDPNNKNFLSTTYLYPKNNTQKLKFDLTKYVLWNEKDGQASEAGLKELAGAKFQLYRGKPGEGQKVGNVLTSDEKGQVTADNLIMGDYYFVEVPSEVANDDADNQAKAALSPIAKNDKDNKLTFSIGEDGIDPTKLQGSLVDYGKPEITKKLTNGVGEHQSLHSGDHAHFKSDVTVPQNIAGSAWKIDATGTEAKSEPYSVFYTRDEPQKYLKDVDGERNLKITTADGKTLEEGKDYEVLTGDNKWFVNYITQNVSDSDKAKIEAAKNSHDNKQIQDTLSNLSSGSATETVMNQAGKKLHYDYDQIVTSDVPMDTDVVNDIYLGWNDGSGYRELKRSDKTITYGVHFVKESSGFMGTGIAAEKLQGAQFAVQDLRTGKWFNGFKEDDKTGEKTAQWVDDYKSVKEGILTSDKEGKFELQGFTEGDYKLREVKAPNGYQLMDETVSFKIGPHTDGDTLKNPVVVKNNEKTTMPLTGSQKLLVATAGGAIVVTVLGFSAYTFKKKFA